MNSQESYNPFGDKFSRTSTSLPEIYDQGSQPKPTNTSTTVKFDSINDYAPFTNIEMAPDTEFSSRGAFTIATNDFEIRQSDLEARSQRLAEEEEQFRQRQSSLGAIANFPPFPKCCPLKPCFYQDIDVEIPEEFRPIVKFAYAIWISYCAALFLNIFGALTILIAFSNVPGFSSNTPTLFGVSILLFILFVPLSYLFWFRRLYIAFKTNSSFHFFLFFISFSLCVVSLVVEVIGIPQCGVCGWIVVVMTKDKVGVMVFTIIIATIFTALTFASFYLILRVNLYFRSSGGSLTQARQEVSTNASQSNMVKSFFLGAFTSSK